MGDREPRGDGAAPADSDGTPRAETLLAQRRQVQIEQLYTIGKLLADFERIDDVITDVLAVVTTSLPLHTVVLVTEIDRKERIFTWCRHDASSGALDAARKRAIAVRTYFVDQNAVRPLDFDPDPTAARSIPGSAWPDASSGASSESKFIALPLVAGERVVFGTLQLETAGTLDETSLRFASAVTSTLAVSLARHGAKRREQAAREALEEIAARLGALERIASSSLLGTTIDETLKHVVAAIRDVFRTDVVNVTAAEDGGGSVRTVAALGFTPTPDDRVNLGAGIVGAIVASGRSRIVDDTARLATAGLPFRENIVRSMMAAPLHIGGTVRGAVWTGTKALRHFAADELRLFELIADRLAVVMERSRLYEDERALRTQLEDVNRATSRIGSLVGRGSRNAEAAMRAILDEARVVTNAEFAMLCVGSRAAHRLGCIFPTDDPREPLDAATLALIERVGDPGGTTRIESLRTDPDHSALASRLGDIDALLVVPIDNGHDKGMLYVGRPAGRAGFTERDALSVELLVGHAAIAIENARLYEISQRAVAARDDVLAVVSHDLRSPLSVIELLVDLGLRAGGPNGSPAIGRGELESIQRATATMGRLINDLLDAATIDAGRFGVAPRAHAVAPIVEEAVLSARAGAATHGLRVIVDAESVLPQISCDRQRILQVLANLIGNAVRFTPAGGSITVRAAREGNDVRISVIDTGAGIAPETLPHLFFRYSKARKVSEGGAGLGLFITKGIVEAHGGTTRVESTPGAGSTFSFTIPIAR